MRSMSQITEEVLDKETERFNQDERTAGLADSMNELEQMGFTKKFSYEPNLADTIGRRFYDPHSTSYGHYMR